MIEQYEELLEPPSGCEHIHYLRRALLQEIGGDVSVYHGQEYNLDELWPMDMATNKELIKDGAKLLAVHAEKRQNIEGVDPMMRYTFLERLADRFKSGNDRQAYRILMILALDALLEYNAEQLRKAQVKSAVEELFGDADGARVSGISGRKH